MRTMTQRSGATRSHCLHFLVIVLFFANNCFAIKYNIWFKYPQPYNPSEPLAYCKENTTDTTGQQRNCTSQINIYTNTLDSPRTYIPYSYNQFDFCPSIEGFEYSESDLIEWDDRIFLTSYEIKFLRNEGCRLLCKRSYDLSRIFDIHRISVSKMLMNKQYYQHLFADNFPISFCYNQNQCVIGVPIGYYVDSEGNPNDPGIKKRSDTKPDHFYLFNHLDFTFIYESGTGKTWGDGMGEKVGRITQIKIRPRSIKHEKNNFKNCAIDSPLLEIPNHINYSSVFSIYHSYSVTFIRDDTTGAEQRWNRLLSSLPESNTGKWFILSAILLVIVLSIPFVFVLSRTILTKHELFGWINTKSDPLSNPNAGWQCLANDIFRSPKYPLIFSSLIGSGVQYICCLGVVEVLTVLIHFSTSLVLIVLVTILLILLVGSIGGYVSSRFYRSFGGQNWKQNCLLTSALNPIVLTAVLFLTRNFLLLESSSALAFPIGFTPALFVLLISFCLALPLTFAGSYFGYTYQSPIEYPVRPTANVRDIPKQSIYNVFLISLLLGSLVPFVSVWIIENYPFLNSGELVITMASILICAQTSVVFSFLNLMDEEHRWWWRSYLTVGFASVYYFIHCFCLIMTTIIIDDLISGLLYVLFALVLSVLLFSLIGTIGFLVSFAFIWALYSMNKPNAEIDYSTFPEAT